MHRKYNRGNVTKGAYVLCLTILPLDYVHFSNCYIVFRPFRHILLFPFIDAGALFAVILVT